MEKIDLSNTLKGEASLTAYDALTGEKKRESKGFNTITRRGLLEMIVPFLNTSRTSSVAGNWGVMGSSPLMSASHFDAFSDLPPNCGSDLAQTRANLLLLGDSTPAESVETMVSFAMLRFSHSLELYRNMGSDSWNATLLKLNMSWSYGAADWSGIVNSIIIGKNTTSPTHAIHRVILGTPFEKLSTENAVLNWTWTINLPAV